MIRELDIEGASARLAAALAPLGSVHGEGLYRAVEVDDVDGLIQRFAAEGILVGKTESGALRVAPALDVSTEELAQLEAAVARVVSD